MKELLQASGAFAIGLLLARPGIAAPGQSFEAARNHWAYQPIARPAPPKVKATQRVQSPIDAFLLVRLEEKNLTFALPADKRTLFRAFDFAVPDQCVERRPRTTVPQQALSAFVMEQARGLVMQPEISSVMKPAQRVDVLFRRALGRAPTKQEAKSALRFIEAAQLEEPPRDGLTPWAQFAQILLATNELAFLD